MGLKLDEIDKHAENIMLSRRILNRVVILCEGDISSVIGFGNNPARYGRLESKPDSSFYKECLPKTMRRCLCPQFFNCGSRVDVIRVFLKLRELHKERQDNSYLDVNKLFAIVDLDSHSAKIDNYSFQSTEDIFYHHYNELEINSDSIENHIICTTGLIHKEAYFLLPHLKGVFDNHKNPLFYKDEQLSMSKLYSDMINELHEDNDLRTHFEIICKRISFSDLDCSSPEELKNTFINAFNSSVDDKLISALFLIRRVKPYWEKIYTSDSISDERLREQLSSEIAKFYSEKNDDNFHITAILKSLYNRSYGAGR